MAYKAPRNGVVRLRRDPMALMKQLAITFTGLVVVTASMLLFIYMQGGDLTGAGSDFGSAGATQAPAPPQGAPGADGGATDPALPEATLSLPNATLPGP